MKTYVQGDVMFRAVDGVCTAGKVREDGVVARGEATGHAHRVVGEATVFEAAADRLMVEVVGTAEVVHEEHAAVTLAPGIYEVIGQREYTPAEIRRVAD